MQQDSANSIDAERERLARSGHLHWFHWAIVILSGVLTVAAWQFSRVQVEEKNALQFDREAAQVVELVKERMQKYEDALWSGVAAIKANGGDISHAEWRVFADSLNIDTKYPGINGIGVIMQVPDGQLQQHIAEQRKTRPDYDVHPAHETGENMPIVYIEPEAPNAQAVGLDIAHELNRYTAASNSRDSGTAQITGPIVLVQDSGSTPGFLFYVPYYEDAPTDTVEARRAAFIGMVYAPFVVRNLMAGTLDKERRRVGIALSDGDEVIYDEHNTDELRFDPDPMFSKVVSIDLYGRSWTFDISTTLTFRSDVSSMQPTFILLGGILIDGLLLTLFILLSRSNRHTLRFADRMTEALRRKASALAESNADLESFAYIASHDLKTPLRGIADLTTYIEEDLQPYFESNDTDPEVSRNFERLRRQTRCMEDLIRGILEYSRIGGSGDVLETLDVHDVLENQRLELELASGQLVAAGELPKLKTYPVRFEQVMSNLIGNAFKYHHDRSNAVVTVSCEPKYEFYEFTVSDNGPGIDPKFHGRIFEVFQTLQSKDKIESTGIGLAIVKKSVEALGGDVSVASQPGTGTTFTFSWPRTVEGSQAPLTAVS